MSTVIDANPATPAAPAEKKQRGKPKKDAHPLLQDGGKLDAIPDDHAEYATLKEDNFTAAGRPVFLRWSADRLEEKVKTLHDRADRAERLGAIEDTKTAQTMDRHLNALMESYAKLKAQGTPDEAFDPRMLLMLGVTKPDAAAS